MESELTGLCDRLLIVRRLGCIFEILIGEALSNDIE